MSHKEYSVWLALRVYISAKGCLGVTGHVERLPLLAFPLTQKWRKHAKGADVKHFPDQKMYKGLLKDNSVKRNRYTR